MPCGVGLREFKSRPPQTSERFEFQQVELGKDFELGTGIDRHKSNNDSSNLIPLCWRCHQLIELITIGWQRSKFTTKSTKRDLNKIVRGFKWVGDELVY